MASVTSNLYAFGEFRLDSQNRVLSKGDEPIALTPKALEVLCFLIQHSGEVVTKDELMQAVWPDRFVEESNLTQTVFMLRKALGDTSSQRFILTVQGRGYRFVPEVKIFHADGDLPGKASSAAVQSAEPLPAVPDSFVGKARFTKPSFLAFAALTVVAIGLALWLLPAFSGRAKASIPMHSIAVLPLDNFSGDSSQEYFVDGMTDELITDLAKVRSLHVVSRTSVMRYKGTKKSLPEIARELNVDGIVEGSVTRSGQRVRITAQLIHASTDKHLWAETYERDLGDVLRLQNDVARTIAQQVQAQLTPQDHARLSSARPVDPQAYEEYLKGRYYLSNQFTTGDALKAAKNYFEDAIRRDPQFALAYSGLADSYVYLAFFRQISPDAAYRSAKEALAKVAELDSTIGEVHDTLGLLSWRFEGNFDEAERQFNEAIAMSPSYSCAHEDRAVFLSVLGRRSEAMDELAKSKEMDPGPSSVMTETAIYYQLRDHKALIEASERGVTSHPDEWTEHYNLAVGYLATGKRLEAVAEYQKAVEMSGSDQDATAALANAYAAIGRRAEAESILRDFQQKAKTTYVSPYMIATVYAGLGDKNEAFKFLDKAYQQRSLDLTWHINADIRLDPLRSDPRFEDLRRRLHLN